MLPKTCVMPAVLVALIIPALAQDPAPGQSAARSVPRSAAIIQALPNAEENAPAEVKEFASGQLGGSLTARDIINQTLYDTSGNEIGLIADLAVDENDDVSLVVVDVKGDEQVRQIAFDFEYLAYQTTDDDVRIVANIRQEDIETAPSFKSLADAATFGDMQREPD